ncbi:hypothetical protein M8C21_011448, partial [Ambrosia artemisiifolia]
MVGRVVLRWVEGFRSEGGFWVLVTGQRRSMPGVRVGDGCSSRCGVF